MRDMLDAAWGDFPTEDVGFDWARYTGNARPEQAWCDAVLRHSLLTFIMETYSTRSQEGQPAGIYDCQLAEPRARERHPDVLSIAYVVSDGNGADSWSAFDYGFGVGLVCTIPPFPYGAAPICATFLQGLRAALEQRGRLDLFLDGEWIPITWGAGRFISQLVVPSPIANTDLNIAHAPYYPTTNAAPAPTEEIEVEMILHKSIEDDGSETYYRELDDGTLVKLSKEQAGTYYQGVIDGWIKVHPLGGNFLTALQYTKDSADARRFVAQHMGG